MDLKELISSVFEAIVLFLADMTMNCTYSSIEMYPDLNYICSLMLKSLQEEVALSIVSSSSLLNFLKEYENNRNPYLDI
jgi:hypothetical protein